MALVPMLAINSYVGYRLVKKGLKEKDIEVTTQIVQVQEHMSNNMITSSKDVQDEKVEKPDSQELTVLEKLHQEFSFSNLKLETILSSEDRNSNLYISALYEKTRLNGISEEDLRRELNNILVCRLLYTDFENDEWNRLFGNLQRTLDEEDNALEYYYPLAQHVHESECKLEHSFDDIDRSIMCDALNNQVNGILQGWEDFENTANMIESSGDTELIDQFNQLFGSGINVTDALKELEILYVYSQVPRCLSEEEWYGNFSTLLKTVDEGENIFEVYRKLSIYMHLLDCSSEHYENEYGVYVCKTLEKTIN